ncbi:MAG: Hsp20/alpha crystallin family protein [Anaerolineales bacterium]
MVAVKLSPDPYRSAHYVLRELQQLGEEQGRSRLVFRSHMWRPPTDVYETENAVVVRVEIAGMEEKDFSIIIDERYLLIRGVRAEPAERRAYHQMEIRFGEFATEVELPYPVVVSQIEAIYASGFLLVTLPKAQPHKIHIET